MNKEQAIEALEVVINGKWKDAKSAFDTSRAGATSEQSKQEGKYDTRATEEAYLAHGLANSVSEYERALSDLNVCRSSPIFKKVSIGSLIKCLRGDDIIYFLMSESGGGIEATVKNEEVTIITPSSPLAKKLLGTEVGEKISSPPLVIRQVS